GGAYLVDYTPYREFLLTVTDQKEMSTCSGLAALDFANTKFSRGYSATGVGMGFCEHGLDLRPAIQLHIHRQLLQIVSYDIRANGRRGDRKALGEHRGVAGSTREMGPGSREDTLNCHWNHWNWQKLLGLAERLRTRTDRARTEGAEQVEAFATFSAQQAERVPSWRQMVHDFEADGTKKNPYETVLRGLTEAQVLLKFSEEEKTRAEEGVPGIHDVSPSSFIAAGLEVEDQQAREPPDDEQVERLPLFLPSALTDAQRQVEPVKTLSVIEDELRDAQCGMALLRLRNQLHIKSRLLTYKEIQARNQGPNTRSRSVVETNESKIRLHSEKYQMAWDAKRRLNGGTPEAVGWRILRPEDIRCMEDAEEIARGAAKRREQAERRRRREEELRDYGELPPAGAGRRRGGADGPWWGEPLRIEWCKAYARVRRWKEEAQLLLEEVRRLPISYEYEATIWEQRVVQVPVGGDAAFEDSQGAIAYGLKQAAMYRALAARVPLKMTELIMGRGKRRKQWSEYERERMEVDGEGEREEEGQWGESDKEELDDLRGDVSTTPPIPPSIPSSTTLPASLAIVRAGQPPPPIPPSIPSSTTLPASLAIACALSPTPNNTLINPAINNTAGVGCTSPNPYRVKGWGSNNEQERGGDERAAAKRREPAHGQRAHSKRERRGDERTAARRRRGGQNDGTAARMIATPKSTMP
ncbi:hypothetical protein DFH09DRAFT_1114237, partial [Mycena vulgaris]